MNRYYIGINIKKTTIKKEECIEREERNRAKEKQKMKER